MKLVETSVCWRTHPSIGRRPAIFNQMIGVGKTTIAAHRADRRLAADLRRTAYLRHSPDRMKRRARIDRS